MFIPYEFIICTFLIFGNGYNNISQVWSTINLHCDVLCRLEYHRANYCIQGIKQYYVDVGEEDWKFDTFYDLYGRLVINQAIIFCNTRQKVLVFLSSLGLPISYMSESVKALVWIVKGGLAY